MWTKTAVFPACSDFTNSCFSSERRPGTILRRDGAWRFARESQAGLLFNPNQSGRVSVPIYFGAYAIDMRKPSRPAGLEGFLSAKLMAFCESSNANMGSFYCSFQGWLVVIKANSANRIRKLFIGFYFSKEQPLWFTTAKSSNRHYAFLNKRRISVTIPLFKMILLAEE